MIEFSNFSNDKRFEDLCNAVKRCELCPDLMGREHVLSEVNGDINSEILFIAEAPGRLGADRTGIPLNGDRTGDIFEELIDSIGWNRGDIFITNAVLCNPRGDKGNNRPPRTKEVSNCSAYLEMTIELINPQVIVTLGIKALNALRHVWPHQYELRHCVGQPFPWFGKLLVPLYHTGPRALIHRPLSKQKSDFSQLSRLVSPSEGILTSDLLAIVRDGSESDVSSFQMLITAIVNSLGKMTYFKLTKLLYLIDLHALEKLGRTLSGEIYIRQKEGPWPPEIYPTIEALGDREIYTYFSGKFPSVMPGPSPQIEWAFINEELEVIEDVLHRYGNLTNAGIKVAAYRTPPMQYIRQQEKLGINMVNKPVIYKNNTAPDL